jgi:heme oxygenase
MNLEHASCRTRAHPPMHPVSHMLIRLDLETRAYHPAADRAWLEVLDREVTPSEYAVRLMRVFGFEAPIEAALAYTPHLTTLVELRPRFRSGLIAQDLLVLGRKPGQLATLPQCMVAPFRGIAEGLGWLYVMERATLLHRAVRAWIITNRPDLEDATSYLSAYDGVVGMRREELGRLLDQFARTAAVQHQVLTAAHDAFRCALAWEHQEAARVAGG